MNRPSSLLPGLGLFAVLAPLAAQKPWFDDPDRAVPWIGQGTTIFARPADIDGDGFAELWVDANDDRFGSRFLVGTDTGRYRERPDLLPVLPEIRGAMQLLDVDGDGDHDALVEVVGGLRLLRNVGGALVDDGTVLLALGGSFLVAQAFDADGDGLTDLVIGNVGEDALWLGVVGGGYIDASAQLPPGRARRTLSISAGDVDADGDVDLLLVAGGGVLTTIYFNGGGGNFFGAGSRIPAITREETEGRLSDFDGDGDLDAIIARGRGVASMWLNDGSGTFVDSAGLLPPAAEFRGVDAADLDGDGDTDLVVRSAALGVATLRNDGTGRLAFDPAPIDSEEARFATFDAEGDGDPDLLLVSTGEPTVRVLLNDGSGDFTDISTPAPSLRAEFDTTCNGDFDGDGDVDVLSFDGDGSVRLWRNDGDGYGVISDTGLPLVPRRRLSPSVADLDGDGDLDVFLGVDLFGDRVFLNDGGGGFTTGFEAGSSAGLRTAATALGDVDADGDLDVLSVGLRGASQLWLNDGAGGFTGAATRIPQGTADLEDGAFGDLDGDGDLDALLLGNEDGGQVWLNDGTGRFTLVPGRVPTGLPFEFHLALADLDGDGDLDAATGCSDNAPVVIWLNDGAALFTAMDPPTLSGQSLSLVVADVDLDGDPDVVRSSGFGVEVVRNDGAGVFVGVAHSVAQDSYTNSSLRIADFDGDGDPDVWQGTDINRGPQTGNSDHRLLRNMTRQLAAPGLPRTGRPWALEVHGAPASPWLLQVAAGRSSIPIPGIGVYRLDPTTSLPVASGSVPAEGLVEVRFSVPNDVRLLGVDLSFQALVGAPSGLTNARTVRVTGL